MVTVFMMSAKLVTLGLLKGYLRYKTIFCNKVALNV